MIEANISRPLPDKLMYRLGLNDFTNPFDQNDIDHMKHCFVYELADLVPENLPCKTQIIIENLAELWVETETLYLKAMTRGSEPQEWDVCFWVRMRFLPEKLAQLRWKADIEARCGEDEDPGLWWLTIAQVEVAIRENYYKIVEKML